MVFLPRISLASAWERHSEHSEDDEALRRREVSVRGRTLSHLAMLGVFPSPPNNPRGVSYFFCVKSYC